MKNSILLIVLFIFAVMIISSCSQPSTNSIETPASQIQGNEPEVQNQMQEKQPEQEQTTVQQEAE